MKSPYANELEPNHVVTAVFLVQAKDIRQKKSGEPYLSLTLGDRTGDVDAKMWDNAAEVMYTFERQDFIKIKALYHIFQNRPQLTVHKLQKMDDREVDYSDFFPATQRDVEAMFAELRAIISRMSNPHLRGLLERIFDDPRIAACFKRAPAAKVMHHAFLGGLLEHVLSVANLALKVGPHYPSVDVDLLLTGAMLHDLGKIDELSYERGFAYTHRGQLIGHIVIGIELVAAKMGEMPAFPPRLRTLVEHLILSHHGELEYGSPKMPLFPEALLLHHLDNLDSKMENMRALIENDRFVDGCWTGYSSSLERTVLKKSKFLEDPPPAAAAPPPAEPPPPPAQSQPRPTGIFGNKLQQALGKD